MIAMPIEDVAVTKLGELKRWPRLYYRARQHNVRQQINLDLAHPDQLNHVSVLGAFVWGMTREGYRFWDLVSQGRWDEAQRLEPALFD